MVQHYPLHSRPKFNTSFQEAAAKLLPLYRQRRLTQISHARNEAEQQQSSSPVCYAHLKGMREGFDDVF